MVDKKVRHILGLSGGKDSTALAIYLHDKIPNMEYFFCDTHEELPETYEFLDRLKARLGIEITYLSAERGFTHWLSVYKGFLPSPRSRWCTKQLKIIPLERFVGNDEAVSYIGIRVDEDRDGYISSKDNITPVYPFKEDGLVKDDIIRLLEDSGIGMPKYYEWRSRSGCYFCFFQRKYEWVMLSEKHPDLFKKAVKYETEHSDGRKYYWNENEPLLKLLERKEQIMADYKKAMEREQRNKPNQPLSEVLSSVLDEEDEFMPCSVCHL